MDTGKRRALLARLFVGALIVLCAALGILQYRWIGELSEAEKVRIRQSVEGSLIRLSQDFNNEVTAACASLMPAPTDGVATPADYADRFGAWKESTHRDLLFRSVSVAVPDRERRRLKLIRLDRQRDDEPAEIEWPGPWLWLRDHLESRLQGELRPPRKPPLDEGLLIELPRFVRNPSGPGRREGEWLILELDPVYLRNVMFPELLQRHLGEGAMADYQVEVTTRGEQPTPLFQSRPGAAGPAAGAPDAAAGVFDIQYDQIFRRGFGGGPPRDGRRAGRSPDRPGRADAGRWLVTARHRAGSVDTIVSQARVRNLAVTFGILLLMLITVGALARFTRDAQRLAQLQMDFVAGVSHELRTPLTVIRTAAFNLRGRLSGNPAQIERYGSLIQNESERLTELVEQILQFASARSGQVIREWEPVDIATVIEDSVESSKAELDGAHCNIEIAIEPDLPPVVGDARALKQALRNLIGNAVKYGREGGNWIGVTASAAGGAVEIRVADRGPGIPREEQRHVFDPFYRGKRALENQIHGTGLGLSLVKGIVEAHGGAVTVRSEPSKGTEFAIRIPTSPGAQKPKQNELSNTLG